MDLREVLHLFVVRPPEPIAAVYPDRLGSSEIFNKLIGLVEKSDVDMLCQKLESLRQEVKLQADSVLLALAKRNLALDDIIDLAIVKSTSNMGGEFKSNRKPGKFNVNKAQLDISDGNDQPTITSLTLKNELTRLRDYWAVDYVLKSSFARKLCYSNSVEEDKESQGSKQGELVALAMKIGTIMLLKFEQPSIKNEKLESIMLSPVTPSVQVRRAIKMRQYVERSEKVKASLNDPIDFLVERREILRKIRRICMGVLDNYSISMRPEEVQVQRPGFLSRLFSLSIINRSNVAKKSKDMQGQLSTFVKEVSNRLDDAEKAEFASLSSAVAGININNILDDNASLSSSMDMPGAVMQGAFDDFSGMYRIIEEEICNLTQSIAVANPSHRQYAKRLLASAYSQPQMPMQPVGFIELMRVTEELAGYTAREIAHIENKSGGETRERIHTFTESNQNILSTEQFEETEETRDLQTTQRNELQSAVSQVTEQEFNLNAGLNVSASYGVGVGPSVQVDASFAVGYRSATTKAQQTASNISKEIIAKTVSRIKQNQRRTQTATVLRTLEERNRHEYKVNVSRTDTYLWVEKLLDLRLRAYGKRLIMEFIVPEPGLPIALKYMSGDHLSEPEAFDILPSDINMDNFSELKQRYGATGISPPPAEFLMVGAGYARKYDEESNTSHVFYNHEESIKVPVGYIPHRMLINTQGYHTATFQVAFAGKSAFEGWTYSAVAPTSDGVYVFAPNVDVAETDPQSDGLSMTITAFGGDNFEGCVNAALICRCSCRTYQQWQLDTHDRLYAAYRSKVAEYEEKKLDNPVIGIVGGSSSNNREAELEAIKMAGIYILKGEPVFRDLFASDDDDIYMNTFDIAGTVRLKNDLDFFEEAFEWHQCTYRLYSSFWGNVDRANNRKRFHTTDQKHASFLAAGAARVLLPVLPGREREVLEYLAANNYLSNEDQSDDTAQSTAEEEFPEIWNELPPELDSTEPDTWRKSLIESREDLVYGQGSLSVTQWSKDVSLNDETFDPLLDLGREIWIEGRQYFATKISNEDSKNFELDQEYSGVTNGSAEYLVGARTVGAPWRISIPTSLVVLQEFKDKIENM